jgi:hypothetical protein
LTFATFSVKLVSGHFSPKGGLNMSVKPKLEAHKTQPGEVGPCQFCAAYWAPRKPNPVQCPRCHRYGWKVGATSAARSNVLHADKAEIVALHAKGVVAGEIGERLRLRADSVQRIIDNSKPRVLSNVKTHLHPLIVDAHKKGISDEAIAEQFNTTPASVLRVVEAQAFKEERAGRRAEFAAVTPVERIMARKRLAVEATLRMNEEHWAKHHFHRTPMPDAKPDAKPDTPEQLEAAAELHALLQQRIVEEVEESKPAPRKRSKPPA